MTAKEQKKFHTMQADHHLCMAKCHTACASCESSLAEKADAASYHRDLANCHRAAAESHTTLGEYHLACAKACDNTNNGTTGEIPTVGRETRTNDEGEGLAAAFGTRDLGKLVPTAVSAVAPEIRLVPRNGAPNNSEIDASKLDADAREMLGV
jgi:hypothetical protein